MYFISNRSWMYKVDERLPEDYVWIFKRDRNEIRLSCTANGNAEIDSDGNVRARERTGSNIFSPDYLRAFSQMQYAGNATAGAIVHFFIRAGAPATHLRGEKRVARPPGISSDILFMKHLIYTGA